MTKISDIRNVTVSAPRRAYGTTVRGEPPQKFCGQYTLKGQIWWRHVSLPVDIRWTSVESAIEALTEAAAGLIETSLNIDEYDDYGSRSITTEVSGQRPATDEEIVWVKKQITTDLTSREQAEQREIENFRRKHPDLLK